MDADLQKKPRPPPAEEGASGWIERTPPGCSVWLTGCRVRPGGSLHPSWSARQPVVRPGGRSTETPAVVVSQLHRLAQPQQAEQRSAIPQVLPGQQPAKAARHAEGRPARSADVCCTGAGLARPGCINGRLAWRHCRGLAPVSSSSGSTSGAGSYVLLALAQLCRYEKGHHTVQDLALKHAASADQDGSTGEMWQKGRELPLMPSGYCSNSARL